MANENNVNKAKKIYATMVKALRKKDWKFDEKEDELLIVSGCKGDDLAIPFVFKVDPMRDCLTFRSPIPVTFSEEKRVEGAVATCVANRGMVFGHFDYDIEDGEISYTMSDSYLDCEVGEDFFMNMMMVAINTTDRYNDRFAALASGVIDIKKFIEMEG